MSGTKFLLDTNIVLGVLNTHQPALELLQTTSITDCGYSVITRMELLGFPGINQQESKVIEAMLSSMPALPLDKTIEDKVINLRQQRKIKLPDAIIAATALVYDVDLITLDQKLKSAYETFK